MWKLRNVYLYLICFVTLMMMIFGIINVIGSVTDIIFPTTYYYSPVIEKNSSISADEARKIDAENKKREDENRRLENKKSLVKNTAVFLIALPVFAYHWRKIEKEKDNEKKE